MSSKPSERGPVVLVLSPTRELAMQTAEVYNTIGKDAGIVWCVSVSRVRYYGVTVEPRVQVD